MGTHFEMTIRESHKTVTKPTEVRIETKRYVNYEFKSSAKALRQVYSRKYSTFVLPTCSTARDWSKYQTPKKRGKWTSLFFQVTSPFVRAFAERKRRNRRRKRSSTSIGRVQREKEGSRLVTQRALPFRSARPSFTPGVARAGPGRCPQTTQTALGENSWPSDDAS